MDRKREQLKLYLNGVKSVIEETCRDEYVSLPARQVLTAVDLKDKVGGSNE